MGKRWNADEQAKCLNQLIGDWATKHPDKPGTGDERLLFQHDRDRIVWSASFKRLAQKTQVFPQAYGDHHRTRLTHSLEVMQLSTSIARTLGLNPLLCEAIALAHDLGHTPFGHAGEDALDNALQRIKWEGVVKPKHLNRFTHYEHGVDVASYIDSSSPEVTAEGLHLDDRILEGILKHTYDHSGPDTKHKSLKFVLDHTKYKDRFDDGPGSLEAQAVRICDKLSYFISDIEDGLAIGAIHLDDLQAHELLKKELDSATEGGLSSDWRNDRMFLFVRNSLLTKLVESVLDQSSSDVAIPDGESRRIIINLGATELDATREIYEKLQKRHIFSHFFVERATQRAKHVVACLCCQFLRHPELVSWPFRRKYLGRVGRYYQRLEDIYGMELDKRVRLDFGEWFENRLSKEQCACSGTFPDPVDRRIADWICVKDYVAGMTDRFAEKQFKKCVCCPISQMKWEELETVPVL